MKTILKQIAIHHHLKLIQTFALVLLENALILIYPLMASFAINAMVAKQTGLALSYAAFVLFVWLIGSARRAVDTRTFARIYAQTVVPIIVNQRKQGQAVSAITARVALSREFVNFFEEHLPTFVTAVISLFGAALMLCVLEPLVGVTGLLILLIFMGFLPKFAQINDRLYFKLNNRLEQDVHMISGGKEAQLTKHYRFIAKLRILISNREALGYLCIGTTMSLLFTIAIIKLSLAPNLSAGHIYALFSYLWTFAISLDDAPRLIEQYSELKDIGKRVQLEQEVV
ncbi:ABC transporter six-transmembrane domain-containing protein [Basilea psittacipulmonis]|uniref:Membrane protein n=1 Tax=Basilea psittacipulmonis DSM 24701 TaxID=1072685 RepID=A0A077DEJ2_9BURK|nr:ABC transporter six-transmembrane domain-containing protein [Basilea psittacipulmonis]AIL32586.1 membrane protein [Basilea psittacipulmonis DSM 24701]